MVEYYLVIGFCTIRTKSLATKEHAQNLTIQALTPAPSPAERNEGIQGEGAISADRLSSYINIEIKQRPACALRGGLAWRTS